MSKGLAAGKVVRSRTAKPEHCLALSGKGAPLAAELAEAIAAVTRAAGALRDHALRGAHPLKLKPAEIRFHVPATGARGGPGWTVFVRVPPWVGEAEAKSAVQAAAAHSRGAKSIRLSPVFPEAAPTKGAPGRDRQPGQIKRRRGGPQHRAREQR